MKKQLFSFLLILTFVFSVSAQKAKQSKVEKNLRTHVSYLASDQLEGRRTGERGAISAAGYVANMFANYKLKAGMRNASNGKMQKSFLQKFPYVAGIELGEANSLTINNTNIQLKSNWMPVGYSPNGKFSNTEVVFAGFGISSDELKYDDYATVNASNKIALVLGGTPDAGSPHSEFARFNSFAKANIAKSKGAKALLIIANDENFADERLAKLDYNQTLGETAIPTVVISRQATAKLFDTDEKGFQEIEKWMAMRKDTPENIRIRLANLPKISANLNIELIQKQAEAYNVIGIVEGRDPVLKNEAIVIGAHYDHLGKGGEGSLAPNSKDIHHGADDNASGTSAMLELARQFRKEKNNKRTLIFIGFGGEEEGLLGSKYYVNNPVFPIDKTIAMINMDMVGRLNEGKLTVGGIGTASEFDALVKQINSKMEISHNVSNVQIVKTATSTSTGRSRHIGDRPPPEMVIKSPFTLQLNQDGFGPSDHSSFYGKQIPVLFFFTGTHTDYHKPSDTAGKINYDGLEKVTYFVSEIVKSIDQNPTRPTYTKAKSSDSMGGRRSFNVSLGTIPSYSDSANDGLVLDGVRDDSAADKAGIKGGDKIIKIGDKEVRNISDYMFMLGEMKAGEEYEIVVMRGTEKVMLKIVPDAKK
jgi:hypothetical protein